MRFSKINAKDIDTNVFKLIRDDWALVTGGDANGFNMMTASWGALGILWGRPIAECFIRPQRYTLGFLDKCDYYTLSFYDEKYRKQLNICGTKSGRDIDKVKETGFTPVIADCGAVYFEEAKYVLVCKKIYESFFDPEKMSDKVKNSMYSDGDYHKIFYGEIIEVLKNEG